MDDPPQPADDRPLDQYLHVTQEDLIGWMQGFKNGAIKVKINWGVELLHSINILLTDALICVPSRH